MTEVRTVNEQTGGEKGVKQARFDLLPARPLTHIAEHYGKGAEKYADRNWEKGYEWSKSFAALQRHAWAFWSGETYDPETGSHHLAAVAFHAMAMMEWEETRPDLDDRPGVVRFNVPPVPEGTVRVGVIEDAAAWAEATA